ncbi:MAG: 4Fe-4S dicluster domain-containing protein [Verrucomicrobiae bacterium]|nr:4Fe-4S dicluster domain-containing protein [Verrucomicrobiae bacterium]
MLHDLQPDALGPHGQAMTDAVSACVHCGFCLPTCPTYRELGEEMDSPRGRIILMKEVLEGRLPPEAADPYLDRCLGCVACEPACPSGVEYGSLISPYRARRHQDRRRPVMERLRRAMVAATLPHPGRLALSMKLANWAKPLAGFLPRGFRPMLDLVPDRLPLREPGQERHTPEGRPIRARVALLAGCAQQVLAPEIQRDAIEVLLANGVEVIVPEGQGCCGALSWHIGQGKRAVEFASANLDAFGAVMGEVDAIVTTAAGCGSTMREYGLILAGTGREDEARGFVEKVRDIAVFLRRLGWDPAPPEFPEPVKVAYQDACHLANAQGVIDEPRGLLRSIGKVELVEIADPRICCGSAGTYNLDQPEIAAALGRKKAQAILETGASLVASGNIGCLTQLRHHLGLLAGEKAPELVHTVTLLARAYRGESV